MAGEGCCCLGPDCCLQGQEHIASGRTREGGAMSDHQSRLISASTVEEDDPTLHLSLMAEFNKMECAFTGTDEVGPCHQVADTAANKVHEKKSSIANATIRNSSLMKTASISGGGLACGSAEIEEPGPSHQVAEMVADAFEENERAIAEAVTQCFVDPTEIRTGEASAQGLVQADEVEEKCPFANEDEMAVARAFQDFITEDEIAIASAIQDFFDDDELAIAEAAAEGLYGGSGSPIKPKRKHEGGESSRSTHGRHV